MDISLFAIEMELRNELEALHSSETSELAQLDEEASKKLFLALAEKTDQVAHFRESLFKYTELLQDKINELKIRQSQIEKQIDNFDNYVMTCMNINGRDEFKGQFCKIKKRNPTLKVEIYNEELIPIEFIKVPEAKPTIMVAEIAKLLKQGEIIDGAKLVDGKTSLMYSLK